MKEGSFIPAHPRVSPAKELFPEPARCGFHRPQLLFSPPISVIPVIYCDEAAWAELGPPPPCLLGRGNGAPDSLPATPEAASGGPMREDRGAQSPSSLESAAELSFIRVHQCSSVADSAFCLRCSGELFFGEAEEGGDGAAAEAGHEVELAAVVGFVFGHGP